MEKVKDSKFLLEYDYKSFFPNLEVNYVSKVLGRADTPPKIVHLIENLNKSQPKLTVEDKVDESKAREYQAIAG